MYSEKLVTAKKPKRCVWCGEQTEVGEKRWNRAYIFDGEFQSDYLHPECKTAMLHTDMDLSDGFDDGQFRRGKTAEESEEVINAEWRAEEAEAEAAEAGQPIGIAICKMPEWV